MSSEHDIVAKVRSALQSEPRINLRFRLDEVGFTDDGALIVAGEVDSVAGKKLALEHISALPEVEAIVDRLHVRPAQEMGDAEIRAHLRRAYQQEPSFSGLRIAEIKGRGESIIADPDEAIGELRYEVAEGVVTLSGTVAGLEAKRLAGVLAWWVPGSRDVANGIAVPQSEIDSPISIEEGVRVALDKDPFVNASQIRVGVRLRTVRLTGVVRSEAERDMAEKDAWYVFGVDDVINEIGVER